MIQLRRLKECILQICKKNKQLNGTYVNTYEDVKKYKIISQELTDEVSASIYGANINRVYRISSPYSSLENYLYDKVSDTEDNISNYFIFMNNKRYKIVSVKSKWIDIELI